MLAQIFDIEPNLLAAISRRLSNNDNLHLFQVSPALMRHFARQSGAIHLGIGELPLYALAARYGSRQCAFIAAHHDGHSPVCSRLIGLGAARNLSCWDCMRSVFVNPPSQFSTKKL